MEPQGIFYKATRLDGTDFRTGEVDYAGALTSGELVVHESAMPIAGDASTYLSVSSEPAETLIGGTWPCRLFRVEPSGPVVGPDPRVPGGPTHKTGCSALYVREELPAWRALGPNGARVVEFLASVRDAVRDAARDAAWDAAWDAARDAVRDAAWEAARGAARDAAWNAAWGAALAAVARDLITSDQYEVLRRPWDILTGQVTT